MKPLTATILVAILLFVVIASVLFALALTSGHESVDYDVGDYGSIFEEPSEGTEKKYGRRILCGVLLSTFGVLGIIGNIIVIIVFTRPSMRSATNMIFCGKYFFNQYFQFYCPLK